MKVCALCALVRQTIWVKLHFKAMVKVGDSNCGFGC